MWFGAHRAAVAVTRALSTVRGTDAVSLWPQAGELWSVPYQPRSDRQSAGLEFHRLKCRPAPVLVGQAEAIPCTGKTLATTESSTGFRIAP